MLVENVDRYRVMDPMFECVRIVLAHRGEEYSPAYIQGISGMAFRIAGPCPCAPTSSMAIKPPDLVRLLGYEAEELSLVDLKREEVPAAVPDVVARVKAELRAGRPAIVWHAFTNAEFDVVSGFDEEKGTFLGYGSYAGGEEKPAEAEEGRLGTCLDICGAYGAVIVGKKTSELDAREAELAALEEAVRHAHSPRGLFLDEVKSGPLPWRFREGLACYDVWARQFEVDPQKVPDGPSDRYPLGVYSSTRGAAAEFLRSIAPKYPEAREQLGTAAGHFEADAAALVSLRDDVFGGWGPKGWKKPDPAKAVRAVELLRSARASYAKGIQAVEAALQAIDPERVKRAKVRARVRREGGEVWIDGVGRLKFGVGRDNTFCGALFQALRLTDNPYTYHDLMGLSGLAFRVRWCNDDTATTWCPSVTIGEMPDEQRRLTRRTGWELPFEWQDAAGAGDDLRRRIVGEVDAGRPVVAYPPVWNVGLIYGYEDEGRTLLVADYLSDEHPSRVPLTDMGPMRHFLGEWKKPPPLAESLRGSLAQAICHWRRDRHHGGLPDREYWYGRAAFDAWVKDLRGYEQLTEESQKGFRGIHGWNYHCLHDARKAARQFLKDWGTVTTGGMKEDLARAEALYEKQVKTLEPFVKRQHDRDERPESFAREAREEEAAALEEAKRLEGEAVAAMADALRGTFIHADVPAGAGGPVEKPVLLQKAVDAFAEINATGTHEALVGAEVYVQHYVLLSATWILMRAAEWDDADFDTLAAVSGASALYGYQPGDFMPKYAHTRVSPHKRITEATGFGWEWASFDDLEGAWKVVKTSIDSGKPLFGWDWENLVIAGYREAETPADRLVFAMADGPDTYGKWWTWKEFDEWVARMLKWGTKRMGRYTERVPAKAPRDVALRVMRDLVAWSESPPEPITKAWPKATWGLAGMDKYADNCADTEAHEDWGLCHPTNPQIFIRNSTNVYLAGVAQSDALPEAVRAGLSEAATAYRTAYEEWRGLYELLGHGAPEGAGKDPKRRQQGAAMARRATEHERAAIGLLKKVLAAVD